VASRRSRRLRIIIFGSLAGIILASCLFSSGIFIGILFNQFGSFWTDSSSVIGTRSGTDLPRTTAPSTPTTSEELEIFFAPFWSAWGIVHDEYVDQPVDDLELMRGAIRGMLDALGDPHTSYMDPDEYTQANIPLEGSYEGIGAWVDPDAEYLTIVSPMPNSPAERAGLKPGDEVVAVDGDNMTGVDGNLVIRRVLGPAGTPVRLTIRREGEPDLLEFEIIRKEIDIPSVEGEITEEGIAYVQLFSFADKTSSDLRSTLETLLAQNPKGLIFDLRFNGGGFLPTAIEVVSEFISEGVVMIEQFGDETEQVYEAIPGGVATEIPLIVLINDGTASASEIVAGAIQDYDRGLLVGEITFGKGSVQNWIPLSDDGGAVRITIARWYTPLGRQIHELGLTPDVEVLMTDEDIEANRDIQLEKAIELLIEGEG